MRKEIYAFVLVFLVLIACLGYQGIRNNQMEAEIGAACAKAIRSAVVLTADAEQLYSFLAKPNMSAQEKRLCLDYAERFHDARHKLNRIPKHLLVQTLLLEIESGLSALGRKENPETGAEVAADIQRAARNLRLISAQMGDSDHPREWYRHLCQSNRLIDMLNEQLAEEMRYR